MRPALTVVDSFSFGTESLGFDDTADTITVANHRVFESFGNLTSETDPANGRWLSDAPISFAAGDTNVQRYVGNADPSGLANVFTNFWNNAAAPALGCGLNLNETALRSERVG